MGFFCSCARRSLIPSGRRRNRLFDFFPPIGEDNSWQFLPPDPSVNYFARSKEVDLPSASIGEGAPATTVVLAAKNTV